LEEEAGAADLGCELVGEGCGCASWRAGGQWGGRRGLGVGSAGGRVVVDRFAGELRLGESRENEEPKVGEVVR
jgi:hypothetical protein